MFRNLCMLVLFSLLFCLTVSAQTADEIINKNLAALGGVEKIKALKTVKMTGKLVQAGQEFPLILQIKRPGSVRFELSIQGKSLVQGYDGSTGWAVSPFNGTDEPEKLSEEDTKDLKDRADLDGPLVDYKAKGSAVELVGKDDVEGDQVYKLKLTEKEGKVSYIFIDAKSFLEVKSSDIIKRQGIEAEVEVYYSDYKAVNGVMLPHSFEGRAKGQPAYQIVIQKIETDVQMDDVLFKLPVKTQSPAK